MNRSSLLPGKSLLLVAVGGAVGTELRYGLIRLFSAERTSFPTAIFLANLLGCVAIGVVVEYNASYRPSSAVALRALLGTGFCGGLTTFSTLVGGVVELTRSGDATLAILYAIASVTLGLALTASAMVGVRYIHRGWSAR